MEQDEDQPIEDVVVPALDRASTLADRLARLLVPARLFS